MKKTIVVKLGGVASDNLTDSFFSQIKEWHTQGYQVVIVHGGGHYITKMMNKLNIPVTIKAGLRVTTEEALAVTKMVLIGQVQPMITTYFQQAGFSAVGLNASSAQIITGDYLDKSSLGAVGKVVQIDPTLVECLLNTNHLPIIAPLGLTSSGEWLNINADLVACELAQALQAEKLYLLTDVPGVKNNGTWLAELTAEASVLLKEQEVLTGGMLPKIESALTALKGGVTAVHITNELQLPGTLIHQKEVLI